jgi:CcmD family protein
MPKNIEFVIAAYGIVYVVILLYSLRISFALRAVKKRLRELERKGKNET